MAQNLLAHHAYNILNERILRSGAAGLRLCHKESTGDSLVAMER